MRCKCFDVVLLLAIFAIVAVPAASLVPTCDCPDDGDPCTIDECVDGVCVHTPIDCDDGDPCTIDECVDGVCVHTPIDCDDGDPCTIDECVNGVCVHTPIDCDDGDACTDDYCDPVSGCQHEPIDCNDDDPCTDDSCENGVCVHTPIDCDDGDACTDDSCENGVCVHTPIDCDDGDACTDDYCDPVSGCQHVPIDCDDGDPCTLDECVDGECVYTSLYVCVPTGFTEVNLIAGQNYDAGDVSAYIDDAGENLIVEIDVQDPWILVYKNGVPDTAMYVGTTPPTSSAPGKLKYSGQETYTLPLADLGLSCDSECSSTFTVYVAVHANVYDEGDPTASQTAWSEGTPFGNSWAMYFTLTVSCEEVCPL